MAKIMSVDYNSLPVYARQIKELGKSLNEQIQAAYRSITDMHAHWYGKRYNALAKEFNNMIPQVNEISTIVIYEIPRALGTVANNYSAADMGVKVTGIIEELPKKITEIAMPDDVGMRFLTEKVEEVQKNVSLYFKKAEDEMSNIEREFAKVNWSSESATLFRQRLSSLKKDIVESFQNIDTQFTKLMNQTKQDIQNAENNNAPM